MTCKAIPFTAAMTRAIMTCARCGRVSVEFPCTCGSTDFVKTNTRRPVNPQPFMQDGPNVYDEHARLILPPYQRGDILWVREPGRVVAASYSGIGVPARVKVKYPADGTVSEWIDLPKRIGGGDLPFWARKFHGIPNGIFREAARLFLEVEDVQVQRVQDITVRDAMAEGIKAHPTKLGLWTADGSTYHAGIFTAFRTLWDSIYAKRGLGWDANPWVFANTFKRTGMPEGWEEDK